MTIATALLVGAACCVYLIPASDAATRLPITVELAAGAVGALVCLAGAALLFTSEW